MTLEKLLFFGVALAVVVALTAMATGMASEREVSRDGYKSDVETLLEKLE